MFFVVVVALSSEGLLFRWERNFNDEILQLCFHRTSPIAERPRSSAFFTVPERKPNNCRATVCGFFFDRLPSSSSPTRPNKEEGEVKDAEAGAAAAAAVFIVGCSALDPPPPWRRFANNNVAEEEVVVRRGAALPRLLLLLLLLGGGESTAIDRLCSPMLRRMA